MKRIISLLLAYFAITQFCSADRQIVNAHFGFGTSTTGYYYLSSSRPNVEFKTSYASSGSQANVTKFTVGDCEILFKTYNKTTYYKQDGRLNLTSPNGFTISCPEVEGAIIRRVAVYGALGQTYSTPLSSLTCQSGTLTNTNSKLREWTFDEENLESVSFTASGPTNIINFEIEYELPGGGDVSFSYPPVISLAEGYTDPVFNMTKIKITNSTLNPDATIFYTLDGTTPKTVVGGSTKEYTGEIELYRSDIKPGFAIQAIAVESGKSASAVVRRELSVLETEQLPFTQMVEAGESLDGKLVMAAKNRAQVATEDYGVTIEGCFKVLNSEMRYLYTSDYEWKTKDNYEGFKVGNMLYTLNGEDFPQSYYDTFTGRHTYEKGDEVRYIKDMNSGAVGLLGVFSYNNGLPECRVTGYSQYLDEAKVLTLDYDAQHAYHPEPRPHVQRIERQLTTADYARHVVYPYTKVASNRIVLNDGSGATVQLYSKFEGHTLNDLVPEGFSAAARYDIEGFVGYEVGVGMVLYPTAIYRCPLNPVVKAPNILFPEYVEGPEKAHRLELDPTYTSAGHKTVDVEYVLPTGVDMTIDLPDDPNVKLYYKTGNRPSMLYPYDDIEAVATEYTEGTVIHCIKASLEKDDVSHANFVAVRTDPATGIKSLSQVVEVVFKPVDFIMPVETVAMFRLQCYERPEDEMVPVCRMTAGKLSDAKLTVVRMQGNWIYLAQPLDHGGHDYMLVYNANGWEASQLQPGDDVTDFAIKPMRTSLGNWVGDATGFSRTFKVVDHADPSAIQPQQLDIATDSKTFDNSDLAHYFNMTNVYVEREGTEEQGFTYTLRTNPPMEMYFDLFGFTGGWNTRYADENTPYEMTGVVVRKGSDNFAFCPLELPNRGDNADKPYIYIGEQPGDSEFLTEAILRFGIEGMDEIPAGAEIYYTIDGSNPFDNTNRTRRKYNPDAPEKINATVTVRAYSARRGTGVSAEAQEQFTRKSVPVNFLANFIYDNADPDILYSVDGEVTVLACSPNYLFVQGQLGNVLPIYNTAGWKELSGVFTPGSKLKGFVLKNAGAENFRMADATGYDSYYTVSGAGDEIEAEAVESLTAAQYGRLVKLRSVAVDAVDDSQAARAAGDFCSGTTAAGEGFLMSHTEFGELPLIHGNTEGRVYDITGIVMPSDNTADATPVMWVRDAEDVTPLVSRTPNILCEAADGVFYPETYFHIDVPEGVDAETTEVFYSLGSDVWNSCAPGEKIAVDRSCTLSAYIVEQGRVPGETVTLTLTRQERSGNLAMSATHSDDGMVVSITPVQTPQGEYEIYYTFSTSAELTATTGTLYAGPFKVDSDCTVRAILVEKDKAPGQEAVLNVTIPQRPAAPEVSGRVKFTVSESEGGNPLVTIEPEEAGAEGKIYFTLSSSLPLAVDETMLYTGPIELTASATVRAMLVETGKTPGDECFAQVWVTTDIDGIESDSSEAVRVEGGVITAPQGSRIYDMNGRSVNAGRSLSRGIYIVVLPDGKSVKVAVR